MQAVSSLIAIAMSEFLSERPDSPCIKVCIPTVEGRCVGCGRTLDEVADWAAMTPVDRDEVWARILSQGYPLYSLKS